MLTDNIGQGISSRKSYVSPWGGDPTRECLWIISPTEKNAIIQLQINQSHLNVTCTENAVIIFILLFLEAVSIITSKFPLKNIIGVCVRRHA